MIRERPYNSRLIGVPLFTELIRGLNQQKFYALIGPMNIGKSLVLDCINERLKKKENDGDLIIANIQSSENKTISSEDFLSKIAEVLRTEYHDHDIANERLGGVILEIIEKSLNDFKGKIIFLVYDILGFPTHIARELLAAFKVCHDKSRFEKRVAAIVTGSADFISMVAAETSPYRFAEKISIEGMDEKYVREYFEGKLFAEDIENDAFEFLYKQTNGSLILLQEIAASQVQKYFFHNEKQLLSGLKKLPDIKMIIAYYLRSLMGQSLTIRMMLRDIENRPKEFDKLLKILYRRSSEMIELNAEEGIEIFGSSSIYGDSVMPLFSPIPFLVACGVAFRDAQNRAYISSPLLEQFLKKRYSNILKADVYCGQQRWEKAWQEYAKCDWDEKYRTISGESRFRLNEVLIAWENSMHIKAQEGTDILVTHFLKGVKHLLLFEQAGVWDISYKHPSPIFHEATKDQFLEQKINNYQKNRSAVNHSQPLISIDDDRLTIFAEISGNPPAIPHILIIISRIRSDREIDTTCFRVIEKALRGFCTALIHSLRLQYEKEFQKISNVHLTTLDRVHLAMAKDPFNLNQVLDAACQSLVDQGYHRIQICLVDPSRTRIQGRNESSKTGVPLLKKNTNYLLSESEKDVQPWVVKTGETYILVDATKDHRSNKELAKKAGMKSACIIPLKIEEGEVIGTIHFERGDKQVPGEEEIELFEKFANQLAAAVRHGQRLAMLRDALNAIDDPILLHDRSGNVLFQNKTASDYTNKKIGWQSEMINLDNYFEPLTDDQGGPNKEYFKNRLKPVIDSNRMIRQYWAPYKKLGGSAVAWLGSPLNDDLAEIIGTVERYQDISPILNLLTTLDASRSQKEPHKRGGIYLNHLQELGYKKARLYIYKKNEDQSEYLESFYAVGFEKDKNSIDFEAGKLKIPKDANHTISWLCIEERIPLIFYHVPGQKENEIVSQTNEMGLPERLVGKLFEPVRLEKKPGEKWIDIPLFSGKRCIGKMSMSPPSKCFTPEEWQYLRLFAQSAGLSIDSAIRRKIKVEEITNHNVIVARMLSHRLNASLGRCLHYCKDLKMGVLPENERIILATILKNRFLGMQILINYLLSMGSIANDLYVEEFNFSDLVTELKQSIDFEIRDWKETGYGELKNWQCKFEIEGSPPNFKMKGSIHLLLRAIENIIVNAIEAMIREKISGDVSLHYSLIRDQLVIQIDNSGPKIFAKDHLQFIKTIIQSSGDLEELTQLQPPDFDSQEKKHHRFGLKISTWIFKGIHHGSIEFIIDEHKRPGFRITLPIKTI